MKNSKKAVMSKQEFKTRWDSSENGGGITFNDIAECAIAWNICSSPRTHAIHMITYLVLKAANVAGAENYKSKLTT